MGDFYQRSLRARLIDGRARFAEQEESSMFGSLFTQVRGWFSRVFSRESKPEAPAAPRPAPRRPALPPVEADATPPASTPLADTTGAPEENGMALDRGEMVIAAPAPGQPSPPTSDATASLPAAPPVAPAAPTPVPAPAAPAIAAPANPDTPG